MILRIREKNSTVQLNLKSIKFQIPLVNRLLLSTTQFVLTRRFFVQGEVLAEIRISVNHSNREIKDTILVYSHQPDYWLPFGHGPTINSLIEQMIDHRQYFLPFVKKALELVERKEQFVHQQYRPGLWGNLVFKFTLDNRRRWMARCRRKTMGSHHMQALLSILNNTREEWLDQLHNCKYIDLDTVLIRIPAISLFPLKLGDMLRILNQHEQNLLSEIRDLRKSPGCC